MPTTSPDSIYYADGTTPASLATITAAIATSVQNALNVRELKSYSWADSTAKAAQTGMSNGEVGYQIDNATYYIYNGSWIIWAKAPSAYTPTITGITSTAFTRSFIYSVSGGVANITGNIVFTGSTTGSGTLRLSLPTGFNIDTTDTIADTTYFKSNLGGVSFWDNSATTDVVGAVSAYDATSVSLNFFNTAATALAFVGATRTDPFTLTTSDSIQVNFSYPVA